MAPLPSTMAVRKADFLRAFEPAGRRELHDSLPGFSKPSPAGEPPGRFCARTLIPEAEGNIISNLSRTIASKISADSQNLPQLGNASFVLPFQGGHATRTLQETALGSGSSTGKVPM